MHVSDCIVRDYLSGKSLAGYREEWFFRQLSEDGGVFVEPSYSLDEKEKAEEVCRVLLETAETFRPLNREVWDVLFPSWADALKHVQTDLIIGFPQPYDAVARDLLLQIPGHLLISFLAQLSNDNPAKNSSKETSYSSFSANNTLTRMLYRPNSICEIISRLMGSPRICRRAAKFSWEKPASFRSRRKLAPMEMSCFNLSAILHRIPHELE